MTASPPMADKTWESRPPEQQDASQSEAVRHAEHVTDRVGETQQSAHENVRQAVLAEFAKATARPADAGVDLTDRVTRPTGEPGSTPDGMSTRVKPREDAEVDISLNAENTGAAVLADKGGYDVKQNPTPAEVAQARLRTGDTGNPSKNPDYLVEGRVFDCYSPTNPDKDVRGVWTETRTKVVDGQTQRVILNLEKWRGDMSGLQQQFDVWPIDDLKEVKAITPDNDIIQIVPNLEKD